MLTWNSEIVNKMLLNVLTALYQPFWFSVLLPGYDVKVSNYSIYSYGTKTIVMRRL